MQQMFSEKHPLIKTKFRIAGPRASVELFLLTTVRLEVPRAMVPDRSSQNRILEWILKPLAPDAMLNQNPALTRRAGNSTTAADALPFAKRPLRERWSFSPLCVLKCLLIRRCAGSGLQPAPLATRYPFMDPKLHNYIVLLRQPVPFENRYSSSILTRLPLQLP